MLPDTASTQVASLPMLVFIVSDYESNAECQEVALCVEFLQTIYKARMPEVAVIDAYARFENIEREVAELLSARTCIFITFGMWSTAAVSYALAAYAITTCKAQPLHLYGCNMASQECDRSWGHHKIRGVRRDASASFSPLLSTLRTLRSEVSRVVIPFDRQLFTHAPEAMPHLFDASLSRALHARGFEVSFQGLHPLNELTRYATSHWRGSNPYLASTDVMLLLPQSGLEPHLMMLMRRAKEENTLLYSPCGGVTRVRAATRLWGKPGCFARGIVKLLQQISSGVRLAKIDNINGI